MRRRRQEEPATLLFLGKVYGSASERQAAVDKWRERRRRWLERLGYDASGYPIDDSLRSSDSTSISDKERKQWH